MERGIPRVEVSNTKDGVSIDPARAIVGSGMTYKLKDAEMGDSDAVAVRVSSKSRVKDLRFRLRYWVCKVLVSEQ